MGDEDDSERGRGRDRSRSGSRDRRRDDRDDSRRGDRDERRDDRDDDRGRDDRRDRDRDRKDDDVRARSRSRSRDRGGRENVGSEDMNLESGAVAYLLGRNGATKQRLANFSGARLEIDPKGETGGKVEIIGTEDERRLARMCIEITLQQRNNGKVIVSDGLEDRDDVTIFDVPQSAVGFVLGARGATLREFETKYRTFMFFDNDNIRADKKRLYILGTPENRKKALTECENAVQYKMSGNGSLSSWRERDSGPRYDRNYSRRSRSRDRDRGRGYDDRDRGYGGRDYDRRSPPRYDDRRRDDRRDRSRSPPRRYDDRRDDRGYDRRDDRGYDDRRYDDRRYDDRR